MSKNLFRVSLLVLFVLSIFVIAAAQTSSSTKEDTQEQSDCFKEEKTLEATKAAIRCFYKRAQDEEFKKVPTTYLFLAETYMRLFLIKIKETGTSRTPEKDKILDCALDSYARAVVYFDDIKVEHPYMKTFTELYLKLHDNDMMGLEKYLKEIKEKPLCNLIEGSILK